MENDHDAVNVLDTAPATVALTGFLVALHREGVSWEAIHEALVDNLAALDTLRRKNPSLFSLAQASGPAASGAISGAIH